MQSQLAVDLVVFDMGGTTVRDEGIVPYAFRKALAPLGIHPSDEELAAVRGMDKKEALAALIRSAAKSGAKIDPDTATTTCYEGFVNHLRMAYAECPMTEVSGAGELFAWLHRHGARVALTTGFSRTIRDLILRRLGWDDGRIDAVVSAEEVAMGRPAPYMIFRAMELTHTLDVSRVAVVGDTVADLEAGINAGARLVVGVLSGAHDLSLLGRSRHTHLLASLAELPSVLQ